MKLALITGSLNVVLLLLIIIRFQMKNHVILQNFGELPAITIIIFKLAVSALLSTTFETPVITLTSSS